MTRMHSRVFEWSCSVFECGYIVSKQSSVFFFGFSRSSSRFSSPHFFRVSHLRVLLHVLVVRHRGARSGRVVGEYAGEVGEYCGDVGEYAGDVGEYAGEVGEYAGDVGE